MAGKGPRPVPGFNYSKYAGNTEFWDNVEKKRKKKTEKKKNTGMK